MRRLFSQQHLVNWEWIVGSSVERLHHLLIGFFGDCPLGLPMAIAKTMLVSMETPMELRLSSYSFSIRPCSIPNTQPLSFATY